MGVCVTGYLMRAVQNGKSTTAITAETTTVMTTARVATAAADAGSPSSRSMKASARMGTAKRMEPNSNVAWWAAAAAAKRTVALRNERQLPKRIHSNMKGSALRYKGAAEVVPNCPAE